MSDVLRLFEARRAGDDTAYYVALPDDPGRPLAKSLAMAEAALRETYSGPFPTESFRDVGFVTVAGAGGPG